MSRETGNLAELLQRGCFVDVLTSEEAQPTMQEFVKTTLSKNEATQVSDKSASITGDGPLEKICSTAFTVGLAAFNAFLQSNVTGPVLENVDLVKDCFAKACSLSVMANEAEHGTATSLPSLLRRRCFKSLDADGVSAYPYIPLIELFCLAKWTFESHLMDVPVTRRKANENQAHLSLAWMRLRIRVWHYKLLTQPNLGPGSIFNKSAQWSDVPSLYDSIEKSLYEVENEVFADAQESRHQQWQGADKVTFLLEKANTCIMLGQDAKARTVLKAATDLHKFVYVLSGALGKRTRFQEKSTSQLVVLARSAASDDESVSTRAAPDTLPLNDETLLEQIEFNKQTDTDGPDVALAGLPASLRDLPPDDQPQLSPLDEIILLTEATLKDAFSPTDSLTSEEILPYAQRVVSDKSTNWQIYTHALLVRSRVELHRSRTVERGVLQMQAVVDQVVVDTTAAAGGRSGSQAASGQRDASTIPIIKVESPSTAPTKDVISTESNPTSFFPAPKPAESAPPHVRLQYVHALSSPPRWHLESELGYAWAGVGSLVSALEVFKRLRLWAEVALCLASSAMAGDEDGRGSGGEDKAKAVLRWQLFGRTEKSDVDDTYDNDEAIDISELRSSDFEGPERSPPPPNAPRLFCILGDIEQQPSHYERSWELSNHRFARAQKSLGECYLQNRDWESARAAYQKAVAVNRLSPELWSRLGDINLRLGQFSDAAEAFRRAIGAAGDAVGGEDARTWSNLGSALYSLSMESMEEETKSHRRHHESEENGRGGSDEDGDGSKTAKGIKDVTRDPATLLLQSLAAYKRGASISHDNWRIWDNVITLASRVRPIAVSDLVHALQRVITIRQAEDALDDDVLRLLVTDVLLSRPKPTVGVPERGSPQKAVCDLFSNDIVPLITQRSELWELISRERAWRGDYSGAIDASEKAWRAVVGSVSGASLGATVAGNQEKGNWLVDEQAWGTVVARTDELVSVLENYGPDVAELGSRWKGKARSAIRSVMGKAKASWEDSDGWKLLEGLLEGLR